MGDDDWPVVVPGTVHSGPDRNAGRHSRASGNRSHQDHHQTQHGEADLDRLAHANDGTVRIVSATHETTAHRSDRPRPAVRSGRADRGAGRHRLGVRTEGPIADAVEAALRELTELQVERVGNSVLARTNLGRPTRVLLAGHIDTVPIADNVPSRLDGDTLHGCGTTDMKSGDAMLLHLAATLTDPARDLTFVFYDCEEIEYERNGLTRVQAERTRNGWRPTWRSSASRPTGRSRPAARAPPRSPSRSAAGGPIRRDRGWGTTRSTDPPPSWIGSRRSMRGSWTSTAASTTRG